MDVPQTAARVADRLSAAKISYEEFLKLGMDAWTEWVDGEVIYLPMASATHQKLLIFLSSLMSIYAENQALGEIFCEPFKMKTGPGLPGRSPDILFVARQNLHRLREKDLNGPADLVVEIVSPDSLRRDRIEKFGEYEKGGVGECWIVDPQLKQADFFELSQGRYRALPVQEGTFLSRALPGLWLKSSWLWQNPLPPKTDILRRWGMI